MAKDPRYVVGLQDTKDPCCYKDVEELDKEGQAKALADEIAKREGRPCIVYDRKPFDGGIIYRTGEAPKTARPEPFNSKRKVRGKR